MSETLTRPTPRRRVALFAALLAASLVALAPARARQQGAPPRQGAARQSPASPLKPCKVPGVNEELLCGKLPVFENRRARAGRKIALNVIVLHALEPVTGEAPLFDLQGGHGVAATAQAPWYAGELKEYRRHRDVVLVDQRGTGASNPLQCGDEPDKYLGEMYPVEYVRNCRKKLEQVADLTQYTSPIAADDLDDVRAWLGYDKINLTGLSYGTRAALVYLRQHPEHVRAALLMGVAPTYARLPMYHAPAAQRAMLLLFDECAADKACASSYPRAREEFGEVLGRLARQPARVKYALPVSKREAEITIERDVFAEKLRSQMYTPPGQRRLPYVIHRAAAGDFAPFLRMVVHEDDPAAPPTDPFIADGMYLSVTCAEDVPFIDLKEAERLSRPTYFGDYRLRQQRRACSLWARGRVPGSFLAPVSSSAPVLILDGRLDPVTPPAWGEQVAAHLPNSLYVLIRHHAHVPVGLTNIECLDRVTLDFLARASVAGLDTSCLDTMTPPPFYVEPPPKQQ
ncbi:MAG: alpha/beta hydrolase [Pyrinomonadaceae bacterium]